MKKSAYIAGLLIFLLVSCKKEKIDVEPEYGESPVFSVEGTIDGEAVSFQAGVDGAYLTTYTTAFNGVNRFSGKIEKGQSYVDFGIFDGNLLANNHSLVEMSNLIGLTQTYTTPLFTLNRSLCTNSIFIDHLEIKVNNVFVGESLVIHEPGIYPICVKVVYVDGTNKEVCNDVIIGYKDMADFTIQYGINSQGYLSASTQTSLQKTTTSWYVDGVLTSSNADCYYYLNPGLHVLTAVVSFDNGAETSHSVIVDSEGYGRYFEDMNCFRTALSETMYQDFKAQFKVKHNGVLYEHVGSSTNQQITITGLAPYGQSAAGHDVLKLTGVVNTQMRNTTNQELVNANFNVVIGIEIP